jgi:hypothetical protein
MNHPSTSRRRERRRIYQGDELVVDVSDPVMYVISATLERLQAALSAGALGVR